MKKETNKILSNYNYIGIYDENFMVLWSDYPRLFRLLSIGSKKLFAQIKREESENVHSHIFRFEGSVCKAVVYKLSNDTFACTVNKQIPDDVLEIEDLFDFIDDVRYSTLDIHSMLIMLDEYSRDFTQNNDEFHRIIKDIRCKVDNISSNCFNILNAFEDKSNCKFIPLSKYIFRTWDIIQFVTRKLGNKFALDVDVVYPCAEIDYSKFELAFYNLVKILLIYSSDSSKSFIKISALDEKTIEVTSRFPKFKEIPNEKCDLQLRAIKHIFRNMGGHFELSESDGELCAYGVINVNFSCTDEDISEGCDIRYIGSDYILKRREETGKYIRIYEKVEKNNNLYFASEAVDLADANNSDTAFAEMFFGEFLDEM